MEFEFGVVGLANLLALEEKPLLQELFKTLGVCARNGLTAYSRLMAEELFIRLNIREDSQQRLNANLA